MLSPSASPLPADTSDEMPTIAIVRATQAEAANIRYAVAAKLGILVVASRISGEEYLWVMRAG